MNLHPLGERRSGVLLHPTSLPGPAGSGELGPEALRFADWLAAAGQSWWQMLPVGPVGYGNSPYSAQSAFAGNPLLVSVELLAAQGLLDRRDFAQAPRSRQSRVDYPRAAAAREALLRKAHAVSLRRPPREDYLEFCASAASWLEDFALYAALKKRFGQVEWTRWPAELRERRPPALAAARRDLAGELELHRFVQWHFDRQWRALRSSCAARGVALLGDLPLFVAHDSADVWANQELFFLDERGQPTVVAGVPPDYFSSDGQRWGNPLYRWELHKQRGYGFWAARLRQMLERFDAIRLDHFIGYVRYWEIAASEPTAAHGRWVPGPGLHFFERMREALGALPMVAEDLGALTPAVEALRDHLGLPGLRVLQFAFGGDAQASSFKPHAYPRNSVAYTGTHDNDTAHGWFRDPSGGAKRPAALDRKERALALRYLASDGRALHWDMIRGLYSSAANLVIIPMQDVLGLGSEARMNRPGTASGNWEWRLAPRAATGRLASRLYSLARLYDRVVPLHADQHAHGIEARQ